MHIFITVLIISFSAALIITALLFVFLPCSLTFCGYVKCWIDDENKKDVSGEFSVILKIFKLISVTLSHKYLKSLHEKRKRRRRARKKKDGSARLAGTWAAFRFKELSVNAAAGAGDSAATALLVGTAYAALSVPQILICKYTDTSKPEIENPFKIEIIPENEKTGFEAEFRCIFSVKPVNIILNRLKERKALYVRTSH